MVSQIWHEANFALVKTIATEIKTIRPEIEALSQSIHSKPELKWEEHHAHDVLTTFMEEHGFKVERKICGLATAWSAEFVHGSSSSPVTIGFNSESSPVALVRASPVDAVLLTVDALPTLGHACGHNLIAVSGCAAAIGTARALAAHNIPGRVLLLGTPAEEGGGGKCVMLEEGAYVSMDACLMLHPGSGPAGGEIAATNAKSLLEVEYFGQAAHAAVSPQTGINALDAANIAYMSINAMRQQTDDQARIHGIMGGESQWVQNIIPAYSKLTYGVRHVSKAKKDALVKRVESCFEAAAAATGCTCKVTQGFAYEDLQNNGVLSASFKEVSEGLFSTPERPYLMKLDTRIGGSTDFGNVTHALPGCHPVFYLPHSTDQPHTQSFTASAGAPEAIEPTLQASTALAVVGLRVVYDEGFREKVKAEFRATRAAESRKANGVQTNGAHANGHSH